MVMLMLHHENKFGAKSRLLCYNSTHFGQIRILVINEGWVANCALDETIVIGLQEQALIQADLGR